MLDKIYLHIGTFKTGSTSLQRAMAANKDTLEQYNIYYGNYFEPIEAHSNLTYGLLYEALQIKNIHEYDQHPRFTNVSGMPREIIEGIREQAEINNCNAAIISHEALFADSYRTLTGLMAGHNQLIQDDVNRIMREMLFTLLNRITRKIEVICYLRRQDLFMESQYNQFCKQPWYGHLGPIPTFSEFVNYEPITLDYYEEFMKWRGFVGKNKLTVRVYEKGQMNGDIVKDFFTEVLKIKSEDVDDLKQINHWLTNEKIDRDIIEYKLKIGIQSAKLDLAIAQISNRMEKREDYAYFTNQERVEFLNGFRKGNNLVASDLIKSSRAELFSTEFFKQIYPGLKEDTFYDINKKVIKAILEE